MDSQAFFSQTYAEARSKFLAAAAAARLALQSHPHPLPGHDGETLAMDVARFGATDARHLLMLTSACHGVEGFCGSGVQNALLADNAFLATAAQAGVAVLFVHALNPHGFSWWRRNTHENVDLNRNWQNFAQPLPANPGYDQLADAIVPAHWPPAPEVQARLTAYADQHGAMALQAAISGGQYRHPAGLFYGGQAPTWSRQTFSKVLQEHGTQCTRLAWIDLHTGLGASGVGERIFAARHEPAALARARSWWGAGVTSTQEGTSSSAPLTGLISAAVHDGCPQAELTAIALEYGTLPLTDMINALRADQWRENHPQAPAAEREALRRQSRDAFYVDTPEWKASILTQARDAAQQAVSGLARPVAPTA